MDRAVASATQDSGQQEGIKVEGNQFLTFCLGSELYGIDILRVKEIKGYTAVTKIPNMPSHIIGVLNLRGSIVPIVELRGLDVFRTDIENIRYGIHHEPQDAILHNHDDNDSEHSVVDGR